MACFPSRFARKEMNKLRVKQRLTCGDKSKIHLRLPTLKSTIFFLSARTSAKWRTENMTFKWLACTSQESVKIPTREERNRPWEGEIAREREKNALKKKIKHERERAHKSISHRSLRTALIALAGKIWWCVNSCDISQQDGQRAWHNAHKRVFDLARANESYYPYCKWISQKLSYLYSNI